jgi:hypothetical protein
MATVRATRKGVLVSLAGSELAVLRTLPEQLEPLLAAPPPGIEATDPVRERLFPRAYLDPTEEQAETEWQALVHPELVREKSAALATFTANLAAVGPEDATELVLTPDEADAWIGALNDARLALGVTLRITEEFDPAALDARDPASQPYFVYDWLTWLQGSLVEAVAGS